MANFRRAYAGCDLEAYDRVLHPDYFFVPLPQDLADLGLVPGQALPRALEMAVRLLMFSGELGTSGAPALRGIDVVVLDPATAWGPCTDPQLPAAALERLCMVEVLFVHAYGYFRVSRAPRPPRISAPAPSVATA